MDTGTIGEQLGSFLYAIVRSLKPETVLETGVASGLASAYILLALRQNKKGKLYSIDLPSEGWAESHPDGYRFGRVALMPKKPTTGMVSPRRTKI